MLLFQSKTLKINIQIETPEKDFSLNFIQNLFIFENILLKTCTYIGKNRF